MDHAHASTQLASTQLDGPLMVVLVVAAIVSVLVATVLSQPRQ